MNQVDIIVNKFKEQGFYLSQSELMNQGVRIRNAKDAVTKARNLGLKSWSQVKKEYQQKALLDADLRRIELGEGIKNLYV